MLPIEIRAAEKQFKPKLGNHVDKQYHLKNTSLRHENRFIFTFLLRTDYIYNIQAMT